MRDKEWGCGWAALGPFMMVSLGSGVPLRGQDLNTAGVRVTLDSALGLALNAAAGAFPDLLNFSAVFRDGARAQGRWPRPALAGAVAGADLPPPSLVRG